MPDEDDSYQLAEARGDSEDDGLDEDEGLDADTHTHTHFRNFFSDRA